MSEFPQGWQSAKLGDVCEPSQYGYTAKAGASGNIHFLRTTDITSGPIDWQSVPFCDTDDEIRSKYLLHDGDVVISRAGSVGFSCLIRQPRPSVFASYLIRFRPKIDADYFKYFLLTPHYWSVISEQSLGIAVQNVNASNLSEIDVPVAPAAEQTRIVAKLEELLSDLDAGVAELKAAQKKLGQYRQSLLKAAVEGALTAEWRAKNIPTETGAQLLERILQERRARWEAKQLAKFESQGKAPPKGWQAKYPEPVQPDTTDLPALPQGWVWATAEMLFSWGSGDFLPASAQIYGEYPVYGGNGVNGRHNAANVDHATIVIGRVGAQCGNVFRTESAAWVTDNAIYATAKNDFITWAFSELVMQAANLGSGSKGGAQPFISQKILNDTFIALPPIREQERILKEYIVALNSCEEIAVSIAISLKQSTAQRQNILRAAFAGQLVPQDPNDEPARVLLERIRAERAARDAVKKPRGRKGKEAA